MNRLERIVQIETPKSAPQYELRVRLHGPVETEYEIWQVPSPATPHLKAAVRVAGLRGRNLELVEHRVLRRLAQSGVKLSATVDAKRRGYAVTEDLALTLGLIFRILAPMRSRENMRTVIEGIEAMEREETAYWLGNGDAPAEPAPGADSAPRASDGVESETETLVIASTGAVAQLVLQTL